MVCIVKMTVSSCLVLSLLIVVSPSLSPVTKCDASLSANPQKSCMFVNHLYQRSTEISSSLAFAYNVKGLHYLTIFVCSAMF